MAEDEFSRVALGATYSRTSERLGNSYPRGGLGTVSGGLVRDFLSSDISPGAKESDLARRQNCSTASTGYVLATPIGNQETASFTDDEGLDEAS